VRRKGEMYSSPIPHKGKDMKALLTETGEKGEGVLLRPEVVRIDEGRH